MALFVIERVTPLPPAEAWRRLTTWERHTATVPLTRMTVRTPPPSGTDTVVVARTGVGRLGFDDPMRVTRWEPERHCRLEKTGRVVLGWAEFDVLPRPGAGLDGGTGTFVRWREDLRVRGLPRALDGLTSLAGRLVFGRAVDTLLRP
ncbi:SRPBCC family protein [Actinacidiphila sp. DG2A-62]|uniref:SRPBCC family protein n=1 Tax=Actinacidiphila sp. DG2A-62 TaxID=3108821 RepID=UPI002DB68324|nr:SRPBCC family protein [Actinacidiphila sp. DG2A-62]MEC3998417.1 SRPBCC family protein [Actinacidiphila sp. DG2A-62]